MKEKSVSDIPGLTASGEELIVNKTKMGKLINFWYETEVITYLEWEYCWALLKGRKPSLCRSYLNVLGFSVNKTSFNELLKHQETTSPSGLDSIW